VDEEILVPIGKARTYREGSDLTIVTYGAMVYKCADAAEKIAAEDDAQIEVIDLRSLRPLDTEAITASVRKTGRLLIVHEAARFGGFAGEITAQVCEEAFEWLDAPIRRITALDTPVPYAPALEDYYLPQEDDIAAAARWLLAY
jgi:pyruvate/2-oxoglutarate/acetoin dehydrogenase E1 component